MIEYEETEELLALLRYEISDDTRQRIIKELEERGVYEA